MRTRRLFSRRSHRRIVLFSSKGKAVKGKAGTGDVVKKVFEDTKPQKIIDFATLASWYAEQSTLRDVENEPVSPHKYAEKQKNLRFLSL